jgi:hypothetical protein
MTQTSTIVIPARFCGPPDSGNGGYTCGLVAQVLARPAEVTLRKPIPIEKPMDVLLTDDAAELKFGEELIAQARAGSWDAEIAHRASFTDAQTAAQKSPAFGNHPFPTCFVCGPKRAPGDGLRIFPGEIPDHSGSHVFAAPWIPAAEFADAAGHVRDQFIWAALDCPTGFAAGFPYEGKLVTGRLGVQLVAPVSAGESCVLVSWRTGVEGRKHHASAALIGENGAVRAHARATWIKLAESS